MSDASDINDALVENAQGPRRSKSDAFEMEQHSLKDQIEAAQFAASQSAAGTNLFGLRNVKLVPPGCG